MTPEPTHEKAAERTGPGRPRRWTDAAARQRDFRQRRRAREQAVDVLLLAVLNARWEDPVLHQQIQTGDDVQILQAVTTYFRARHWTLGTVGAEVPTATTVKGAERTHPKT